MSLEDSPDAPLPELEHGDKVVTIPPGDVFTIIPDEMMFVNHGKKSISFYIQVAPAYAMGDKREKQKCVVHFIPASRRDELAPPSE